MPAAVFLTKGVRTAVPELPKFTPKPRRDSEEAIIKRV